jgi:hypothetical protein
MITLANITNNVSPIQNKYKYTTETCSIVNLYLSIVFNNTYVPLQFLCLYYETLTAVRSFGLKGLRGLQGLPYDLHPSQLYSSGLHEQAQQQGTCNQYNVILDFRLKSNQKGCTFLCFED